MQLYVQIFTLRSVRVPRLLCKQCCSAALRPSYVISTRLSRAFGRSTIDRGCSSLQASAGLYTRLDGEHARVPVGELKIGLIAQERKPHLTNEVLNDNRISHPD